MITRTRLFRAGLAAALVGSAFALIHTSAVPTDAAVSMSVDARAPMQATLLPVVSVFANAGNPDEIVAMRVGPSAALPVTLMPTVYASASVDDFASPSSRTEFKTRDARPMALELAGTTPALRARALPR